MTIDINEINNYWNSITTEVLRDNVNQATKEGLLNEAIKTITDLVGVIHEKDKNIRKFISVLDILKGKMIL